jgi:DNA-binding transcriptional MocR family regulator
LKTLRQEHARRCALMVAAIQRHVPPGTLRFTRPHGGLYLWCRLVPGVSSRALLDTALAAGVAFIAGDAFYPDPAGESELRLCFSSVMPATIEDAVRRLASCLPVSAERRQLRPIA